jgi:hypothetical protein
MLPMSAVNAATRGETPHRGRTISAQRDAGLIWFAWLRSLKCFPAWMPTEEPAAIGRDVGASMGIGNETF